MSTTVNLGWLKDKNGDKFAPKTYTSQVYEYGDTPLDEKLQKIDKELENIENVVKSPLKADVGQILSVKAIDENGKPTEWEVIDNNSAQIQADMKQADKNAPDYVKNQLVYDFAMSTEYGDSEYYQCNVVDIPKYGITVIKDLSTVPGSVLNYYTYEYNCDVTKSPYMKISWNVKSITYSHGFSSTNSSKEKIDSVNTKITINSTQGLYIYLITNSSVLTDEYKELFSTNGVYLQATNESYVGDLAKTTNISVEFHKIKILTKRYLDRSLLYTEDKDEILKEIDEKISTPTTASVGQTLVVKTVDENNKPTEWETIDVSTDSGEDGYSPIATVEQTETGATISIQDKNGTTTAVVNHGEDGKDGKDGKTPYIDEEGFVVCGENNEYPKKVFEYEWKDNYDKINVTAIDYETGILTVDSMPTQITEELSTTVRVFPMLLIEGVTESFQYGFIPEELLNTSESYYAVKVGDSQIKLYNGNNVLNLTDSGNINLTRWKFQVETQRHNGIVSASVGNIEPTHRYKALFYLPYSAHITTALKLTGEINAPTGSANLKGYASQGIQLTKENAVFSFVNNKYESLSMRSVYYGNKYHYKHYPKIYEVDIKKIGNVCKVSATVNYFCEFGTLKNTSIIPMQKVETDIYLQKSCTGFSFTSGNSNFILDGARCEVWDYGEVF